MPRIRALWRTLADAIRGRTDRGPARPERSPAVGAGVVPERLVVGLGNPGDEYVQTRHNVGFRVLEQLAAAHGESLELDVSLEARTASVVLADRPCLLLAPQTFMNRSGRAVLAALERFPSLVPETDLLIVYDDLDLPLGRLRLRPRGGAGGHRGIADILAVLDTRSVPRLRFGIGRPATGMPVVDWVLSPFGDDEDQALAQSLERAAGAVEQVVEEGVERAMGRINAVP